MYQSSEISKYQARATIESKEPAREHILSHNSISTIVFE